MNTASKQTLHAIEEIVKPISIGTNLGLLQLIWAMIQGAFLPARGAVHTALALAGFTDGEVRRSWQALRYGQWQIQELVTRLNKMVEEEGSWQARSHQGYQPVAVDLTAIWRPRLKNWLFKPYRRLVDKGFIGVGYGLIARVGQIDGHRMPLLTKIVRGHQTDKNEESLKMATLKESAKRLQENEVVIHDAGATISQLQDAQIERYVVRLKRNCTGRRNQPRPYKGVGAYPRKGEQVRPLPRTYQGNILAATPADRQMKFELDGRSIEARGWLQLVRPDQNASPDNALFSIWIIDDPLYEDVLALGTNLPDTVSPKTLYQLFRDRWPIEQLPLVSKQLLGCHRQFVFAPESCWRLGELAFFVGNLLTWLALTLPAFPSGFWDRHPKKRPVALEGSWLKPLFQKMPYFLVEFVERHLFPTIYQRELRRIGALKTDRPSFYLEIDPYR